MGGRYPEGRRYIRPDREKKLKRKSGSIQCSVVDVTESPVNYPQKNKKAYYSGKKMAYAETQVIVERNSLRIIDRQEAKGSEHDCKVYKDAIGNGISNSIPLDADLGYLGIEE
jgi:hypothetical protein